jgi:phage host-nuclease inhibitor protein Gam
MNKALYMKTQPEELKTIRDFTRAIRDLMWEADANYGELSEELVAKWEALEDRFETKAENTVKFIIECEAAATAHKETKKSLDAHIKKLENTAKRLRENMIYCMKASGKEECPTATFPALKVKQNPPSVDIEDLQALLEKRFHYEAEGYLIKQDPKPDKTAIKLALQAGKEIQGVRLVRNEKLFW